MWGTGLRALGVRIWGGRHNKGTAFPALLALPLKAAHAAGEGRGHASLAESSTPDEGHHGHDPYSQNPPQTQVHELQSPQQPGHQRTLMVAGGILPSIPPRLQPFLPGKVESHFLPQTSLGSSSFTVYTAAPVSNHAISI